MPIEPKKRRNKQKRSLSKQSSSLSSHGNADARAVDPAHFVTHAEFSPVTPPDTPGTLGYTLPQSTYKSTVPSSDAKTKSLTQSQTWTVHGPLPGHPSAKTLQHDASGQFAGFVVTPSHGAISQERANIPVHQLQQIQEAQKAQAKSNSNLAETAATAKSLNSSCGQTELLSSQSQLISSPAQPMLYSIEGLVYKASSSPARTEAVQPTSPSSSRDPALPKKTQVENVSSPQLQVGDVSTECDTTAEKSKPSPDKISCEVSTVVTTQVTKVDAPTTAAGRVKTKAAVSANA